MTRMMCMAAMCALLSGCGETAYKMGGNTDQYRAAEKICRDNGGDEFSYKACMKEKGWTVIGIEGSVAGTPAEAMESAPAAATEAPIGATAAVSAPRKPSSPPSTPPAGGVEHAVPPTAAAAPAKPVAQPLDPNEVVTVQSWWKYGPSDFKTDVRGCEAILGGNHRYDEVKKTATRAVVGCMRAKGWRAY